MKRVGARKKVISTILIFVGLLMIIVPIVGKVMAKKTQTELLDDFYEQLSHNEATNIELEATLEWGADESNQQELERNLEDVQNEQLQETGDLKKRPQVIGVILIDKIDAELPISEGVDLGTMNYAVGHMPGTAALGQVGNCVLAGHRSHTFGAFFNRLDELEAGDTIEIINSSGESVTYEVYEKLFVDPTDMSVLENTQDYRMVTLITCHPEVNPTQRLIIHAKEKE